ncbi:MAG: putative endolysin [Prokaryotic dsDNA virus sp.]|nr:MAG: putative endolysin [Prokaryotic dsDNA virus sp.]QDP61822.1 MAG: putative endolysin [Prokaryotic dsDNA virus sp.]HCC80365.1 lysozyme [Methylophaga sp.]|tara:strand:+ start:28882 stop:29415 length:534 start_codon:yes stop_codon:yes gene_type:complete
MSGVNMNRFKVGGLTLGSSVLVAFLALWEGGGQDGMTVYADKLAGGLPTACYGITKHVTDEPVIVGEYWSKEKCDRVMSVAVTKVQLELLNCLTHEPPQGVFDAVSSLAWNVGAPKACKSQSVRHINRGDYLNGCRLLANTFSGKPNWSYASGNFIQGLYNRRQAERDNLCLAGLYE